MYFNTLSKVKDVLGSVKLHNFAQVNSLCDSVVPYSHHFFMLIITAVQLQKGHKQDLDLQGMREDTVLVSLESLVPWRIIMIPALSRSHMFFVRFFAQKLPRRFSSNLEHL